jgi:hypothetical protein
MTSLLSDVIDQTLVAAKRIPSTLDIRPWRCVIDGTRIHLLLDRSRVRAVADPEARQARLACGAAVLNLRIALRRNRKLGTVTLTPDPGRPDLLATVEAGPDSDPGLVDQILSDTLLRRKAAGRPLVDYHVPEAARTPLVRAARAHDVRLEFVTSPARHDRLADLVRQAEWVRRTDRRYLDEFARLSGYDHGSPDLFTGPRADVAGVLAPRHRHNGRDGSENGHRPARSHLRRPLLAVMLTRSPGIRSEVLAGMALQQVLLTATYTGLSVAVVPHPFEVATSRARLARLYRDEGEPHALLWVGYGFPAPPVPVAPRWESAH